MKETRQTSAPMKPVANDLVKTNNSGILIGWLLAVIKLPPGAAHDFRALANIVETGLVYLLAARRTTNLRGPTGAARSPPR